MKTIFARLIFLSLLFLTLSVSAAAKKPKMDKPKSVGAKPDVTRLEPRGVQRGVETKIKLSGTNLAGLTEIKFSNEKLTGEILEEGETATEAFIKVSAAADLTRGAYEFSLLNEKGESGKIKFYVDDLPQVSEESSDPLSTLPKLPVTFSGALDPAGDRDELEFPAQKDETLVFDFAAKSIGSKANARLTLWDANGNLLASNNDFDGGDPLLVYKFPADGRYRLKISDQTLAGSPEHFYRLSIGAFAEVTGIFPLSVATGTESEIELAGYNLPVNRVRLKTEKPGEMDVPLDAEKFHARKAFKVLVTDAKELTEAEPNDSPGVANKMEIPGAIGGRIFSPGTNSDGDVDLFAFSAKASQRLIFETMAARRGSPLDTQIEILHADGRPVPRLLLQAVRDSQVTFRAIDSNTPDVRVENWEEMELNQFLYLQGEVAKIFRMPQGPDSGFQFYSAAGKRQDYFNTSPMAHALDEVCYIVEPHPPSARLLPNGLPVFTLYYANDDDGERKAGSDSRLQFTAPTDGNYLVRVRDNLGRSGDRLAYRLSAHEAAPDFKVTLNGANPTVPPGSGQEFSFTAERIDGFEGDIEMEINGLPPGFIASTPVTIQAGHFTANGTIFAAPDAKDSTNEATPTKITATAMVDGKNVVKEVNGFGKIKLGEKPKLAVALEPYVESASNFVARSVSEKVLEVTIAPGEIVPVWLKIKRDGHEDLVTFTVENLPHGVIVDNIGLSGVLIPKEENERQIFLKAAKWVPETDRLTYCQAKQAGNPTSLPLLVHVRKAGAEQKISALK